MDSLLQQLQAHARGFMGAAAKGHAGVDLNHPVAGLCVVRLPGGLDHQGTAGTEGLVKLLPHLRPVLVLHVHGVDGKGAQVDLRGQAAVHVQLAAQSLQALLEGGVRLKPRVHLHILGQAVDELRVDDLPIAVGLVGVGDVRAILHHGAGGAREHQRFGNDLRALGGGVYRQFNPIHCQSSFALFFSQDLIRCEGGRFSPYAQTGC